MASEMTLKSSSYDGRYLQAELTQISNGSAENSSRIKWKLSSIGGAVNDNGYPVFYATGPTALIIGGITVYSKERVAWYGTGTPNVPVATFPAAPGSVSGEITISHDDNGTKQIDVELSTAIAVYDVSKYSDKWVLDTIPRYATVVHSLNAKTETTATINWGSDSTIDYLWYSKDNGSTWSGVDVADGKSGTYTISGLSANTEYRIKTRVQRKDSQLTTDSSALVVTTYDYPKPTTMNDFTIGNGAEITLDNPLGRSCTLDLISKENGGVIGTYTGAYNGVVNAEFKTESAISAQYASIPNKLYGGYYARVTYNGVTRTLDKGNTYTIDSSKCLPEFTDFSYADTSYVANNTGNNQVLVKNLSTLSVTIGENQKMKARNGATPDRYVISIDTKTELVGYAESAVSKDLGSISNKGTLRLTVRAIDSRGLSVAVYKDITIYDYEKPIINVDVKRLNNFGERTALKVNGTFYPVTLANGLNANTIRNVYYRYRELNGTWSALSEFNKTVTGNEYTCNDVELQLDNTKAFEVEVLTYDAMSYDTITATVNVGQGVFFVCSNQKACYVNGQKIIMYDVVDTWGGW